MSDRSNRPNDHLETAHVNIATSAIEEKLKQQFPISHHRHVILARHMLTAMACLQRAVPTSMAIPLLLRGTKDKPKHPVALAIDWISHFIQHTNTKPIEGKDPIFDLFARIRAELTTQDGHYLAQKGMRHVGVVLYFSTPPERNEAISYIIAVTSADRDRMTLERMDVVSAMLEAFQPNLLHYSASANPYGVDDADEGGGKDEDLEDPDLVNYAGEPADEHEPA